MARQWPMPKNSFTLTSGFGPRWGTHHSGLDFGAPDGTPFYACAGGTVQHIGNADGYGQWIVIDHPDSEGGGCTEYGHMWNASATGLKVGDWVSPGQLIGFVGSNGQSTGPHLHLTVWERGYGSKRIDPEIWLQGCPYPGKNERERDSQDTIFGVDVSEHQDGISLAQAASEGMKFAIVRTTDGTYRDRTYRSHIEDAENNGLLTAAYHYLRNPSEGTSIPEQIKASLEVMGNLRRPMWLDCETDAGLSVEHIREAKQLFEANDVPVVGVYSYVPWWEGRIVGGESDSHEFGALWVAAYGNNKNGAPSTIYPGDNHKQWDYPLGNQRPVLWQFGSNADVAGFKVDINAYRGAVGELKNLFYKQQPNEEDMTPEQCAALNDAKISAQQANERLDRLEKKLDLLLDQFLGFEKDEKGNPLFTGWRGNDVWPGTDRLPFVQSIMTRIDRIEQAIKALVK